MLFDGSTWAKALLQVELSNYKHSIKITQPKVRATSNAMLKPKILAVFIVTTIVCVACSKETPVNQTTVTQKSVNFDNQLLMNYYDSLYDFMSSNYQNFLTLENFEVDTAIFSSFMDHWFDMLDVAYMTEPSSYFEECLESILNHIPERTQISDEMILQLINHNGLSSCEKMLLLNSVVSVNIANKYSNCYLLINDNGYKYVQDGITPFIFEHEDLVQTIDSLLPLADTSKIVIYKDSLSNLTARIVTNSWLRENRYESSDHTTTDCLREYLQILNELYIQHRESTSATFIAIIEQIFSGDPIGVFISSTDNLVNSMYVLIKLKKAEKQYYECLDTAMKPISQIM